MKLNENLNKVTVFMADVVDDSDQNLHNGNFASLDLSVCKEDSVSKVICHAQHSAKEKIAWKKSRSNLQEKPSCNYFCYRN